MLLAIDTYHRATAGWHVIADVQRGHVVLVHLGEWELGSGDVPVLGELPWFEVWGELEGRVVPDLGVVDEAVVGCVAGGTEAHLEGVAWVWEMGP